MKTMQGLLAVQMLALFSIAVFGLVAPAKAGPVNGFIRAPGSYELDAAGSKLEISNASGKLKVTAAWTTGGKPSFQSSPPVTAQNWFAYVENSDMVWWFDGANLEGLMHDQFGSGVGPITADLFETCPKEVRTALPDAVRQKAEANLGTNRIHSMQGEGQVGIGLRLDGAVDPGPKKIMATIRASPAATAGIKPGMLLLSVDGTPTAGWSFPDCNRRIFGFPGTKITIEVLDPPLNQTNRLTLERRKSINE
jgi:hypothetical protein